MTAVWAPMNVWVFIAEVTYQGPNDDVPGGGAIYAVLNVLPLLAAWVVALVSRLRRSRVRRRYARDFHTHLDST